MDRHSLAKLIRELVETAEDNYINRQTALSNDLAGLKIYDLPIIGVAHADDPCFLELKKPEAIGPHFRVPTDWLPQAKSVISFFLPYTKEVRASNRTPREWPSLQWLHGRYEGQLLLNKLGSQLESQLKTNGYATVVPSQTEDFRIGVGGESEEAFTCNWSERHIAYVCGLGTFGLSKGLITKRGMAGRFGSIVTELELEADERQYKDIYEYCSMCGACISRCPAEAISLEGGKDHHPCSDFLKAVIAKHKPRYACGKCQVAVPCEESIPVF